MRKTNAGAKRYIVRGLNIGRLLNTLTSRGIEFRDVKRIGTNELHFSIPHIYSKTVEKIVKRRWTIEKTQNIGVSSIYERLFANVGIVVGVCLGIIISSFLFSRIWIIDIDGLERLKYSEIIEAITDEGYGVTSAKGNVDNSKIEDLIIAKFDDISLVSVGVRGCSLIINIKEKEYNEETDESLMTPIVATNDGVIESVEVLQGTACVSAGEIVHKGDVLIAPYVVINGEQRAVRAQGVVYSIVWAKGSVVFDPEALVLESSGNSICFNEIYLFGQKITGDQVVNTFEYSETSRKLVSNFGYILPIEIWSVTYREMILVPQTRDYESQKNILIKESKYRAYAQIKNEFEILNEQTDIIDVDNKKYINTYVKCRIKIS